MSTMLEQSIIDAEALKNAALKNAEQMVIERYQAEIKEAVESLLEQEEEDPLADDPFGDPLGDPLGGEEGVPETDEELAQQIPMAATEGDKLCPCPGEDVEIEIDFDQLAAQMKAGDEPEMGGEAAVASPLMEGEDPEKKEGEEEVELNEEDLIDMLEELTVDGEPTKSGWLQRPDSSVEHEIDILQAKTGVELDVPLEEDEDEALNEGFFGDLGRKAKEKFDEFALQQGEYARQGAERQAKYKKEKEERIAKRKKERPKPGEPGGKKFFGSEIGVDVMDKLREEETEELEEAKKQIEQLKNKVSSRMEENVKYKQMLLQMKDTLNEVNLQNAKLLYTNQALSDDSLNERQRQTIAEAISKACSVEEAKTIFEALQSTVGKASVSRRRAPKSLGEAVERRSLTLSPHRGEERAKSYNFSDRMRLLAGIK